MRYIQRLTKVVNKGNEIYTYKLNREVNKGNEIYTKVKQRSNQRQ